MEFVLANAGKVRREKMHGRDYIVAPLTLIVPGVLNGSQGALYYPPDEVQRFPGMWNGIPMVMGHPSEEGKHVSARIPRVIEKYAVGTVYNDTFDGKRRAEGWFDEERVKKVAPRLHRMLLNGDAIEVSTGLFTNNVPAENNASYNGTPYTHVARDYQPDHLAILIDQRGACSVEDGCGVNPVRNSKNAQRIVNIFCATGKGGGVKATCSKSGATGKKSVGEPWKNIPGPSEKGHSKFGKKETLPAPKKEVKTVKLVKDPHKSVGEKMPTAKEKQQHEAAKAKIKKQGHKPGDVYKHPEFGMVRVAPDGSIEPAPGEKASKAKTKTTKKPTKNIYSIIVANCLQTQKPGPCPTKVDEVKSPADRMRDSVAAVVERQMDNAPGDENPMIKLRSTAKYQKAEKEMLNAREQWGAARENGDMKGAEKWLKKFDAAQKKVNDMEQAVKNPKVKQPKAPKQKTVSTGIKDIRNPKAGAKTKAIKA